MTPTATATAAGTDPATVPARSAATATGLGPTTGPGPAAPCEDDCGIRDVLDRLGDKWSVLVVVELSKGVRRFRELQRGIPGISQRMLTLTTRRLCRDGLVQRTAYPTIPPQVEYRLTPMGRSLSEAVAALADWSRAHKQAIADAREEWDAAQPQHAQNA